MPCVILGEVHPSSIWKPHTGRIWDMNPGTKATTCPQLQYAEMPLFMYEMSLLSQETCLERAKAGLQMFLDHLPIVQKQSPETQEVETLKADLRDLLNAFSQQVRREDPGMDCVGTLIHLSHLPTFSNQFDEQIGTHIILNYMTRFMNDMYRSLRSLIRS
uniref:Granulocyte colony-stimulating factor n=1 Tax=Erpetoichthys calabaricus TaxID=27687 RepID=A0A8C4TPU3_ERPCA